MSNVKRYLQNAQRSAMESFNNADGFIDDDLSFTGDDFFNAVGSTVMANVQTSQPYIVTIKNTNTVAGFPVTILGAYTTLAFTAPNYQNNGAISITMGISGVTYGEFLYQSMNKPFVVGLTYLQSSTANQVLETLTLIQKDVNGNESQKTLVPTIDPYQQQSTIIAVKFSYKIDGFTAVVISSVLASTTAKIYFYPAETSTIARTLTGQRAVSGYGNPNIIKSDKVVLSPKVAKLLSGRR
jgi:hypothetical protein